MTPHEAREAAFANQRLALERLADAHAFVGGEEAKRCYLQAAAAFDEASAWEEYADEIEWDIPPNAESEVSE